MHPEQPGYTVVRDAFERIWRHSVLLLQRGFKAGSIITVDPEDATKLGPPWTRRYMAYPIRKVLLTWCDCGLRLLDLTFCHFEEALESIRLVGIALALHIARSP